MASTLEIVRGISQALSNKHDGALDEEAIKTGLKRREVRMELFLCMTSELWTASMSRFMVTSFASTIMAK